jgi:hypothetical protein
MPESNAWSVSEAALRSSSRSTAKRMRDLARVLGTADSLQRMSDRMHVVANMKADHPDVEWHATYRPPALSINE